MHFKMRFGKYGRNILFGSIGAKDVAMIHVFFKFKYVEFGALGSNSFVISLRNQCKSSMLMDCIVVETAVHIGKNSHM